MAVELISLGEMVEMAADTVYALPARLCSYTVITSGGTVSVSNDNVTFQNITLDANKNFVSSAAYIKVTGATAQIIGKAN